MSKEDIPMEVEDIQQYLMGAFNEDLTVELTTISGTQRFSKLSELPQALRQQDAEVDICAISVVGTTYENPDKNEVIQRTIVFDFDAEEQEGHLDIDDSSHCDPDEKTDFDDEGE